MVDYPGRFAWYELITTDVASARTFYADVMGWNVQDASTPDLAYELFSAGRVLVSGLMGLPEEARKMGAMARWVGYVGVDDIDVTADRCRRLGGTVYVPPTTTNIGRISVVADPQNGTLALVKGLKLGQGQPAEPRKPGRVGWHELLAADREKAFAFYGELFGWQSVHIEDSPSVTYQVFSAAGQTIGGMFAKTAADQIPFWLYYFNVGDLDEAMVRVKTGGGQVYDGPLELPEDSWIARCRDPQGAAFALQGKRNQKGVGWSTVWGGFSSKGKLVTKPRGNA